MLSLRCLSIAFKNVIIMMSVLALSVTYAQAKPSWKDDTTSGGGKGGGKGKNATTEKIQIASAPQSQSAEEGSTVNFYVDASSSIGSELSYQWLFNGSTLSGEVSPSLSLTSVYLADQGDYSVVVSGSQTSKTLNASLTVYEPAPVSDMAITSQPSSIVIMEGSSDSLSVQVSSSLAVNYQWYKDGYVLAGQTGSVLNINSATLSSAGFYQVVVDDGLTSLQSNLASVVVEQPAPVSDMAIISQPGSADINEGDSLILDVSVSASNALVYQWRKDGVEIEGATSASLNIDLATSADSGIYDVLISDGIETILSNEASITVAVVSQVADIVIDWVAPTTRDDGSELLAEDIASYQINMFVASHNISEYFVVDGNQLSLSLPDLPSGDYEFTVQTIDSTGVLSNLTEKVLVSI